MGGRERPSGKINKGLCREIQEDGRESICRPPSYSGPDPPTTFTHGLVGEPYRLKNLAEKRLL